MEAHLITSWGYAWAAAGHSPATMDEMRPFIERYAATLGRPLMTSTRSDCEKFIAGYESKFRANYAWRSLRSFYAWMAEEEDVTSPMARVKAPKVPITDVSVATEDDVSRLLRSISPFRTFTAARDAAIVSLLWATGLRRSELAALRLDDIDHGSLTLVVRKAKNGKSRRVPFDARAHQHLLRYLAKRSLHRWAEAPELWLGVRGPMKSDAVRLMFQRRRDAAGLTISSHSMRRGLAARALRAGVSQSSLMNICGWETPAMVSRYTRSVATSVAESEYRRLLG